MKLRWKIAFAAMVLAVLCAVGLLGRGNGPQQAVREARRTLRQQGFKTELTEFNLGLSPGQEARTSALTNAGFACRNTPRGGLALMQAVGTNAALAACKQDKWETATSEDVLPDWRTALGKEHAILDAACAAALSGPISFQPVVRSNGTVLLPHLAGVRTLAQTLATRTVVSLRDGDPLAGWTNLLALTRLVTAWEPEPSEVSHLVRFVCVALAQNATWEAVQVGGWTDEQLGALQRAWASADFLGGLPETAAFSRASMAAECAADRQQPLGFPSLSEFGSALFRSPKAALSEMMSLLKVIHYRNHGAYEDEKALLLYFREREIELGQAVKATSWVEMRSLPGVTNSSRFQGVGRSHAMTRMNLRRVALDLQNQGGGFLGRAAEAEARRRLVVTALAVERYRLQHGALPRSLQELVPQFLPKPTMDFMDGKPLRYLVVGDGRFVLYSVGLDCLDNAGQMPKRRERSPWPAGTAYGMGQGADLVWPRPASLTELQEQERTPVPASDREMDAPLVPQ